MRFPPQFLDELRDRLSVSEVVGRRVKLRKAGREWKGLSPFNQERTPSFTVNDQKGFYHDFSSGKHGDIFTFVMETEGVTFLEAVERLASLAGMAMPKVTPAVAAEAERRRTLYDVVEVALQFFEASLAARNGAKARGYLADRGIEPNTQLKFRIGYAPGGRFALKEHLGAQGISVEDMIEAGLLISGEDIPVPYDRFRDRVMFPITDLRGRAIAFGGRALDKDAPAKYLNSSETALFHKGSLLYNAAAARQAAHDGAQLIVVEGYIDVIAMVTAGYPATVAPLGTALTEEQLALLWKVADEPVLCFDGDRAGQGAAYRAVDLAVPKLTPGKSLSFATLPEGQDPDDLVHSGGRAAIAEVLAAARPLADVLWMRETETGSFDTPERRARLETRINAITASIGHDAVRKYYRQELESRLRALLVPARAAQWKRAPFRSDRRHDFGGRRGPSGVPFARESLTPLSPRLSESPLVRGSRSTLPPREALILLAILNHPWLVEAHAEEISELEFQHPGAALLRRAILEAAATHHEADSAALRAFVSAGEPGAVLARLESAVTHISDWPARSGAAPEDVEPWWTHIVSLHRKARTLNKELRDAERALGDEPSEKNFAWLRDIQERLSTLEGTEATIEGFGALSGRPVRSL